VSHEPNIEAYRAAVRRVVDWFVPQVTESGMIRDQPDLIAYYHVPNLMAATGHLLEAHRTASWLKAEALCPDGDFRRDGGKGEFIKPAMQWNYINGWLTWGTARLGRFEVSEPAARFLEGFQDPSTGGFLTAADPDNGFTPVGGAVDMGSTCAVTLGMIYSGRWPAAIRGGEFLIRALDLQPEPEDVFYCRFRSDGRAITEFPEDQGYVSDVRFSQPKQAYWYFGFAARLLALLHRATGRGDFLDAALRYVGVFDRCHEDRWTHWANDKVAWASSALYQITGGQEHRVRVGRIFNPLVDAQLPDGRFHYTDFFPDFDKQPPSITVELTLEFAYLLCEVVAELESG
jgi:hypothetical protein